MKKRNKLIAWLLILTIIFTLSPVEAFAKEKKSQPKQVESKSKKEGKIVGEITEKREKNIKHFLKDDMTYQAAIYPTAVHYQEGNQWKDIDNTLSEQQDEDKNNVLENKQNSFKVKFAKNSNSKKLVKVKKGEYELSWNVLEPQKTDGNIIKADDSKTKLLSEDEKKLVLNNIQSSIKYSDIYPNIDLEYILQGEEIKENIILKQKLDKAQFGFNYDTKNIVPKTQKDGTIIFYDTKDPKKAIFKIEKPIMFDSKGEESTDIEIKINESKSGYELLLTPSEEWLNNSNRAYPVTIDPPITTTLDSNSIHDAHISSALPGDNFQQSIMLKTGKGSTSGINRTFISFPLPETLTTSDTIIGAYLYLWLLSDAPQPRQVDVHKVIDNWTSSNITWQNAPRYNAEKIEEYQMVKNNNGYPYIWDVTGVVKEWHLSGANYGLMIKNHDESSGYTEYLSSDCSSAYASFRPQIKINYINNIGLENYWTYHSQDSGRAGTSHVNDYNGSLVFMHNDLEMNGNRLPINISHVYNSSWLKNRDMSKPWIGRGWSLNIYQWIEKKQIGDRWYWIYTDEDGTKHYFMDDGSSNLKDELNLGYTFSIENDTFATIKDKDGNKVRFYRNGGWFHSFEDKNGNKTIAYYTMSGNNQTWVISSLKDSAGREAKLIYDYNGILNAIEDPSGRRTTFQYDTTNCQDLKRIIYSDGKYTDFEYDNNHNLINVINIDGLKTTYEYTSTSPKKVSRIYQHKYNSTTNTTVYGDELKIQYGNNKTDFIDVKNRKTTYLFDNIGKTTCIKDSDNSAIFYKYKDGLNSTKIGEESRLQKTKVNYIRNHNAEINDTWYEATNGSVNYSTEHKYLGSKSLKITSDVESGQKYYAQYVNLSKGKTYILSGYIKTIGITRKDEAGAALSISYLDSAGNWQYIREFINGTTDWQRYEKSFTLPNNISNEAIWIAVEMVNAKGTAYFDCIQLEDGPIASRYNIIENSDFTLWDSVSWNPLFWTETPACDGTDYVDYTNGSHPTNLSNLGMKIMGNASSGKGIHQTINISGSTGDSYVVGGWAKAASIPKNENRLWLFELTVGFKKPDGNVEWHSIPFNYDNNEWQYASGPVVAKSNYEQIFVYASYYNNANTAFFDGIQLYKEEFGNSYQYDEKGNLLSTVDLSKQQSQFQYNTSNDLVKSISPKGSEFKYTYDGKHNLTGATSAENVVYTFTYDSSGNPLIGKVGTPGLFTQSSCEYTTNGNYISKLTDSSGNTVEYNYDEIKGTLNSFKDANQKTTSYQYDELDRLQSVTKDVNGKKITNTYAYENDRIKNISHNGFGYDFEYDDLGNNTIVKVGNQNLIKNTYEARTGKLLESAYGNGNKISNEYDQLDRIVSKKYNGNLLFKYAYDLNDNLGVLEDLVNGVNYRYVYDLAERLSKIKDSNNNTTQFEYDLDNNISKITESFGEKSLTNIAFKELAQSYEEVASSYQDGSPEFHAIRAFDGNSNTRWASKYGDNGYSDSEWIYVDLGEVKNIKKVVLNWETAYGKSYEIQVSNDATNWTTIYSTTNGDGGIDEINGLTASGRYVKMNGKQRGTQFGYSLWDFEVYDDQSITTKYDYDKDNRISKLTINNGSYMTYQYDSISRLTNSTINIGNSQYKVNYTFQSGANGSTTNKVSKIDNNGKAIAYSYDKNGNIETITQGSEVIKYYYDELNEIIREDNQVLKKTITYTYDVGGNLLSKTEYAYTAGTPTTPTKVYSYTYGDTNWKDKLTVFGGKPITYDDIGNPIAYDGWTFTWEQGRQLANIKNSTYDIAFKYNSSGIRTEKKVKIIKGTTTTEVATKYHLVGDKVTQESNGTDTIYYTYDSLNNLVSMNLNGVEYCYIRNAQGDIIGLFDKTGTQVVSYTYDSWGKLISIKDAEDNDITNNTSHVGYKNPYRYRGYRYDVETGLYYLQSRYYNPEWGRFINADGIIGQTGQLLSHNMFAYCVNNPIMMKDPSGFIHKSATDAGIDVDIMIISKQQSGKSKSYVNGKNHHYGVANMNTMSQIQAAEIDKYSQKYIKSFKAPITNSENVLNDIERLSKNWIVKDIYTVGKNATPVHWSINACIGIVDNHTGGKASMIQDYVGIRMTTFVIYDPTTFINLSNGNGNLFIYKYVTKPMIQDIFN